MQPSIIMNATKQNIRDLSFDEIARFIADIKEPAYRAKQIHEWLWIKSVVSFEEMTNLGKDLQKKLSDHFSIPALSIKEIKRSSDNTIKVCFLTWDGRLIESAFIPTENRKTACISSQVGCSLDCAFCATGKMKRERNLSFDEIADQFFQLEKISLKEYGKPLSNVVFMGMGEPLLNYKETLKAVAALTDPKKRGISPGRITISTAGIAKAIAQLGDDKAKVELALSLHAPNDYKRSQIMPINQSNSIAKLIEALRSFHAKTKNKITLEYLLLKGFNDGLEDAKELSLLYRKVPAKLVNIIEYNAIEGGKFSRSTEEATRAFISYLEEAKINVRLRKSRGEDVDAACGQLAAKASKLAN